MRRRYFSLLVLLPVYGLLALAAAPPRARAVPADAGPEITYTKVFKASYPEFTQIKVNHSGAGSFDLRQLDEDASPQPIHLDPALVHKIFDLAAKLHNFDGLNLDVHKRIANLGQKTFRYDNGSVSHQVTFNYTLDPDAEDLLSLLDGIARQEGDLSNLQRTMRYDPLGVNDALAEIEQDLNHKSIPEPEGLLPALDQAAANDKVINIARQRARKLAARIRAAH
ncbi:MAG TPA: hypothetical protein VN661_08800 [Candidatus Acidoferrales bacterium]|nr:hypothetical protein [Candidatus Acidoferrales bacterium]